MSSSSTTSSTTRSISPPNSRVHSSEPQPMSQLTCPDSDSLPPLLHPSISQHWHEDSDDTEFDNDHKHNQVQHQHHLTHHYHVTTRTAGKRPGKKIGPYIYHTSQPRGKALPARKMMPMKGLGSTGKKIPRHCDWVDEDEHTSDSNTTSNEYESQSLDDDDNDNDNLQINYHHHSSPLSSSTSPSTTCSIRSLSHHPHSLITQSTVNQLNSNLPLPNVPCITPPINNKITRSIYTLSSSPSSELSYNNHTMTNVLMDTSPNLIDSNSSIHQSHHCVYDFDDDDSDEEEDDEEEEEESDLHNYINDTLIHPQVYLTNSLLSLSSYANESTNQPEVIDLISSDLEDENDEEEEEEGDEAEDESVAVGVVNDNSCDNNNNHNHKEQMNSRLLLQNNDPPHEIMASSNTNIIQIKRKRTDSLDQESMVDVHTKYVRV